MLWSWEDPQLVLAALGPLRGKRAFVVAGPGESAFALLSDGAEEVIGAVPDPALRAVAELKYTALRMLPVQSFRSLFGLGYFGRRVWFYHYLREALSAESRRYWDTRESLIREGLLWGGLWEQRLDQLRREILPLCHSSSAVARLLSFSDLEAQRSFLKDHWDRRRWRLALHIFLLRYGLPAESIQQRLTMAMTRQLLSRNFLLRMVLTGEFGDMEQSYPSLAAESYPRIAQGPGRLRLTAASPLEQLRGMDRASIGAFHLGNVHPAEAAPMLSEVCRVATPGARILWWGNLEPSPPPASLPLRSLPPPTEDRALFRAAIHLAEVV
jgi:S-adenosylmethionine-diacylglycerol 3-amino-3-carboxypropyl transferase